jgi:hypothetical protein
MIRCPDRLAFWLMTRAWSVLPAPLWLLIASPLLRWAGLGSRWFGWPVGASRSPLRRSFWRVGASSR